MRRFPAALLPLLALLCALLAVAPAAGQSVLHDFDGPATQDQLGGAVNDAGDLNNDGFGDVIVGLPFSDANGFNSGSAKIFSGIDGVELDSFVGDSVGDEFGAAVACAGDVNGDGTPDYIVGAPADEDNGFRSGSAWVYSGFDGSLLHTFLGDSMDDEFGSSVAGAGDVNNDGFDDLIVGAPFDDNTGADAGSVRVHSGIDGSLLYSYDGTAGNHQLGTAVDGVGDLNADGFDDFLIGAPEPGFFSLGPGTVEVRSGFDGSILFLISGNANGDEFGTSVSGSGDLNADGVRDILAGAPAANSGGGIGNGYVAAFSGADGSFILRIDGDGIFTFFGREVSGAGDVDGDGFGDLIIGEPFGDGSALDGGSARVHSGLSGGELFRINGLGSNERLGSAVGNAGDTDGDGFDDFIVGAPLADYNGLDSGRATIYAGEPPPLVLVISPLPLIAGQAGTIDVTNATPLGTVYIAYSTVGLGSTTVAPLGVTLSLRQPKALPAQTADASGAVNLVQNVPSTLSGRTVWLQALEQGAVSNWVEAPVL